MKRIYAEMKSAGNPFHSYSKSRSCCRCDNPTQAKVLYGIQCRNLTRVEGFVDNAMNALC